jgi:hypothetical protein
MSKIMSESAQIHYAQTGQPVPEHTPGMLARLGSMLAWQVSRLTLVLISYSQYGPKGE